MYAAAEIGPVLKAGATVINKSTVPVGTAGRVREAIAEVLAERGVDIPFDVVSNPEFLKEGAAVEDCMRPDRIVLGVDNPAPAEKLKRLYAPFNRNHDRFVVMDVRSAELTKYAANAMLATKISFMNEMASLADRLGAAPRAGAGRMVAVGTTVVRALESWAASGEVEGDTRLFIHGGYRFALVDRLLTNFHVPRSSLLALVEAFTGPGWRDLYREALEEQYRFLSFGDAMLLDRDALREDAHP